MFRAGLLIQAPTLKQAKCPSAVWWTLSSYTGYCNTVVRTGFAWALLPNALLNGRSCGQGCILCLCLNKVQRSGKLFLAIGVRIVGKTCNWEAKDT